MDKKVRYICNKLINLQAPKPHQVNVDNFEDIFVYPLTRDPELQDAIAVDEGVSKGVLIIKHAGEVIKIPFTGRWDADSFDDAMSNYHYACEHEDDPDIRPEDLQEPQAEDFFYDFENASLRDMAPHWDYCALECHIYECAKAAGLSDYFAREWCVGSSLGHPIYVQERARMYCDKEESKRYTRAQIDKTFKTCEKINARCFNAVWIADFIDFYGEAEFKRLAAFLEEYGITDLHDGNVGYIDDLPVLVDYSDYREW